jgi:hypothetical protein
MPVKHENWGPPVSGLGGRETPGVPEPAPQEPTPPPAAGNELATDNSDDSALHRKLVANGMTPVEVGRIYALTPEEVAALQTATQPLDRSAIEAELAEINKRMRGDRRGYFKDEGLQGRHRTLIEMQLKLDAESAPDGEATATKPDNAAGFAPELLDEWANQGGVAYHQGMVEKGTNAMLAAMGNEGEAFQAGFDALPQAAQNEVYRYLALDPGAWRPASDAAVKAFGELEEQAELLEEWGPRAPQKVATIRGRLGLILRALPEADRRAADDFIESWSPAQAKAILKVLAG